MRKNVKKECWLRIMHSNESSSDIMCTWCVDIEKGKRRQIEAKKAHIKIDHETSIGCDWLNLCSMDISVCSFFLF